MVVDRVVSFLFRLNLFLFFYELPPRESPVFQTHLVARAQIFISSSSRANTNTNTNTTQDTRARAHLSSLESRWKVVESRGEVREEQKRKSGNRSRVREGGNGDWKRRGIDENPNQHQRGLEEDKELVEQ